MVSSTSRSEMLSRSRRDRVGLNVPRRRLLAATPERSAIFKGVVESSVDDDCYSRQKNVIVILSMKELMAVVCT